MTNHIYQIQNLLSRKILDSFPIYWQFILIGLCDNELFEIAQGGLIRIL